MPVFFRGQVLFAKFSKYSLQPQPQNFQLGMKPSTCSQDVMDFVVSASTKRYPGVIPGLGTEIGSSCIGELLRGWHISLAPGFG
eukprot:2964099-Amphidinium_carterae.1